MTRSSVPPYPGAPLGHPPAPPQPWGAGSTAAGPVLIGGPVPVEAPYGVPHPAGAAAGGRRLVPVLTVALVLALVGGAVAVSLLLTRDGGAAAGASAGTGAAGVAVDPGDTATGGPTYDGPSGGPSGGSSSTYTADEREFTRDFRDFASARAGSTGDSALVDLGYTTCAFIRDAGGSDAALVAAVAIGVDSGWSDDDATALVAASVVNLCPEYG